MFPAERWMGGGPLEGWFSVYRTPSSLHGPEWTRRGEENPTVLKYLSVPPGQREHDIFLTPIHYWQSDYLYYWNKRPPFQCGFVIHFEPESADEMRVEILQIDVTLIVDGILLSMDTHGVVWFHEDRIWVPPTRVDSCKLAGFIEAEIGP